MMVGGRKAYATGGLIAMGIFGIAFWVVVFLLSLIWWGLNQYLIMIMLCVFVPMTPFLLLALWRKSKFATEEDFRDYYDGMHDQFHTLKDAYTHMGAWGALIFLIGGLIACGITLYFSEYGYALIAGIVCVIFFMGLCSIVSTGDKEKSNICTKCGKKTTRRYGGGTCWDCSPQRIAAIYHHKAIPIQRKGKI